MDGKKFTNFNKGKSNSSKIDKNSGSKINSGKNSEKEGNKIKSPK